MRAVIELIDSIAGRAGTPAPFAVATGQNAGTQGATLWLGSNGGTEPYATGATIVNNTIRNSPGDCILVTFAHDVTIQNNRCEGALGVGIFTGNLGDRIMIEGNTTQDTGDDGIFAETGPFAPQPQHELVIRDNTVTRSNAKGIGLSGARFPLIAENTVNGTAGSGIVIESDEGQSPAGVQGATILGNTLRNIGFFNDYRSAPLGDRHGIRVVVPRYRVEDLTIANNTLEHVAMNGIAVNGVRDLTIDSNTLTKIGSSGLSLGFDRSDDSLAVDTYAVSHNQIDGAGLNGIYLSKVFGGTVTQNRIRDYWQAKLGYGEAAIFFYRADTARHGQNSIENTNGAPAEIKIVDSRSITDTELDAPPTAAAGPAKPAVLPPIVTATPEPAGTDLSVPTSLDPSPAELRVIDDTPTPVTDTGDIATPETVVAETEIVTDTPAPAKPESIDTTPTDPAAPSLLPTPVATTLERGEGSTATPAAATPEATSSTASPPPDGADSAPSPDPDPTSATDSASPSAANKPDGSAAEDRTVFQRFVRWLLAIFQLEE
ncbi:right-handed parallel beta-helix repeat-containing protein, partial [Candidatus Berkelbacteria bacterium]|nr:right-handed parallel beta-helix repeat-containing protein [Candidatus Berkelbacteria bacterium]